MPMRPFLMSRLINEDRIWVSPNGIAFVTAEERAGVLPRMLDEILTTRVMVKEDLQNVKKGKMSGGKSYENTLNARQLALKLVANVTYGYTSAGFSGRMPCAEIADAIVETGRRTLEDARRFVESEEKWGGARVVYGDTDSLFIHLPGRTWQQAISVGKQICQAVTARNPPPIKLKFEKVYHPCLLVSKKRYVGHMYEDLQQKTPQFDAKGIETVRRDSCPLVAKLMGSSLRILFNTLDLSQVRSYLCAQFSKIWAGKVPVSDFVFSKEVRLGTYRGPTLPPAACVARKMIKKDPNSKPLFAQRVRYVVVEGGRSAKMEELVVCPSQIVHKGGSHRRRVNAHYYITRQAIPALARVLNLCGGMVRSWFETMPKPRRSTQLMDNVGSSGTLRSYYSSTHCIVCDKQITGSSMHSNSRTRISQSLCKTCRTRPGLAQIALIRQQQRLERRAGKLDSICISCCELKAGGQCAAIAPVAYNARGQDQHQHHRQHASCGVAAAGSSTCTGYGVEDPIPCESLACPIFYERHAIRSRLRSFEKSCGATGIDTSPSPVSEWNT